MDTVKNAERALQAKPYYIGLDVGTSSVGWAVTDTNYNLLRFRGKHMWGSRMFPEAQTAKERRSQRTMRRRLQRRKQRLMILEALFATEISKVDKQFFERLHESDLWQDDKKTGSKFSLFNDAAYTDKDYHKTYATIYHLRSELANSAEPHDIRLVFLAIHHLLKYRGHFLNQAESSEQISTVEQTWEALACYLDEKYGLAFTPSDPTKLMAAIKSDALISAKKKMIKGAAGQISRKEDQPSPDAICELLAGAKVRLSKLFPDLVDQDGEVGKTSVQLVDDLNEDADSLCDMLGSDNAALLFAMKDVFDAARLSIILGEGQEECRYISEAKARQHDTNHADLLALKQFVKSFCPERKRRLFSERRDKLDNFPAYSRYKSESGDYRCSQESFCKFLEKELPKEAAEAEIPDVWQKIKDRTFFPKLRGTENGLIPYQLQMRELKAILRNASAYLPFLSEADPDGYTVADKILKTFEFRVPYYVGPLKQDNGDKSYPNHWCVRFAGKEKTKIEPWNFEDVVDLENCAAAFMANLVGYCKYTGEQVMPKDSLLYSEYMLRNELNPLRVNGKPLPHDLRERMIDELFIHSARAKAVSKRDIFNFLRRNGCPVQSKDEITGIDEKIKSVLKSRHDFAWLLEQTGDYSLAEKMIHSILVFGEDKKLLRRRLKALAPDLDESRLRYLCQRNYTDWGNLSEYLLTGIKAEINGEPKTVMDLLREEDLVLMQILSQEYPFGRLAQAHLDETIGNKASLSDKLDAFYISPAVERSIRQALKIVDEIVGIRKAPPAKIFVEVARDVNGKNPKQRTSSRKEQLQALYDHCKEQGEALSQELSDMLSQETDERLRNDRLFLYYRQNGKDMYTGLPMDLEEVLAGKRYDRDHIYPRSKIKDDSLDNLVLVNSRDNREKTNDYPLKEEIRARMMPVWTAMRKRGQISETTYSRLIRVEPLSEKELSDFVQRQLVETRQSTKALAELLKERYPRPATKLVYSKAQNVSDFRREYQLTKCRALNDLHHAKDAYLNIVVGNVYDTRFTDRFFANIRNEEYSVATDTLFKKLDTHGAWDKNTSIVTVKDMLRRNDPIVTKMRFETKGALFNLQPLSAGGGQLERKHSLQIERYGGYKDVTGAYFCVIESTEKNKRVRTIEAISIIEKEAYESNPVAFWISHGKEEPKILVKKLHMNSLLEVNGIRLYITGRSGATNVYQLGEELYLDDKQQKLIVELLKYIDWCSGEKQKRSPKFTAADLENLYSVLQKKSARYSGTFEGTPLEDVLRSGKAIFESMNLFDQCKTLEELLNVFQCNAVKANLTSIGGKKGEGAIRKNKNINLMRSLTLIHQSATGLYEYKKDLLKD